MRASAPAAEFVTLEVSKREQLPSVDESIKQLRGSLIESLFLLNCALKTLARGNRVPLKHYLWGIHNEKG